MPALKLNRFSGLRPRVPESLLQEGEATVAKNCDFAYGELRNTKGGFLLNAMQNSPKSIYTDDGLTFYTWPTDVNAVRSPLASDPFSRMYYTGDGGFKVADRRATRIDGGAPGSSYLVGVPRPTVAPVLTAPSATIEEVDKETRAYVYTYVNTYNEEGPPTDAATVTTSALLGCTVKVTKNDPTGYAPIKAIRIYRTPTGSSAANYFYVATVSVLTSSGEFIFTDNVAAELLNEPLSSLNYYPPNQVLVGLMTLPNGILCAWKGNDLHFSEAYKPWAWPPSYVKPLANAIVGGIAYGSGAVITTTGQPYLLSGVSPDSMTASRLNVDQAGVSKWSIAVVDGAVLYASNDGLVTLSGGVASLAQSQRFFTREVWRAAYAIGLSSMRFSTWDGRLVVFSSTGSFTPFMIRVDEADGTMTDLPDLEASCAFISQLSDQFYYAYGTGLYQFNGGADQQAVWQSRENVLNAPTNFGFAQAVVVGNWSIEFYADGDLKHTKAVSAGTTNFRLPGGFKSDRWKINISGAGRFRELRVGNTARELGTV